jgi:hypothetical protein
MTKDPRRFYVYCYLRSKDSANGPKYSPYYIGKGSGNRVITNKGRCIQTPKDRSFIAYVQEGLTEDEAYCLEAYCIALYGRVDLGTGILRNMSAGGRGAPEVIFSKERRKKISATHKGKKKSAKQRQFLRELRQKEGRWKGEGNPKFGGDAVRGELNPMWGKEHSGETREKISRRNKAFYNTPEGRRINKLRAQKYLYELIDPDGEVYITDNLWDFSKQYDLTNSSLNKVVNGKAAHHRGWTGRIVERLA